MTNSDYWKEPYQSLWQKTGEREKAVAQTIESLTGKTVQITGFGAGSDKFLSGTAASHGHEKGEADLIVKGTTIRLEVTGPNITVAHTSPLWIRPDKIKNAQAHIKETDTWIVHCIERSTIRSIHLDAAFLQNYERGKYETVHPRIRGLVETYVAIPYNDPCVQGFEVLLDYIKHWETPN